MSDITQAKAARPSDGFDRWQSRKLFVVGRDVAPRSFLSLRAQRLKRLIAAVAARSEPPQSTSGEAA